MAAMLLPSARLRILVVDDEPRVCAHRGGGSSSREEPVAARTAPGRPREQLEDRAQGGQRREDGDARQRLEMETSSTSPSAVTHAASAAAARS
jgi:hypothetical protein